MRILFYSHIGDLGNGGAESLLDIVKELSKNTECTVVTKNHGSLNKALDELDISNKAIPFQWTSNFNNGCKWWEFRKRWQLLQTWRNREALNKKVFAEHLSYAKTIQPDIIYTNTSVVGIGLEVAQVLDVPHVWHLREFQRTTTGLLPDFGRKKLAQSLAKSTAIITNSIVLKQFYQRWVPNKLINVVYNGLTMNLHIMTNEQVEGIFTFIMVGGLYDFKGHQEALRACQMLMKTGSIFKLTIVGSGPLERELKMLRKQYKLEGIVEFVGQQDEVGRYYKKADCYLMCSSMEAFGRVTLEAMLAGLPVVGKISTFSATKEIIRNEIDGWLYNEENELVQKMKWMMENPKKGKLMGLNGQKRALQEFSLEQSVKNINEILYKVMSND